MNIRPMSSEGDSPYPLEYWMSKVDIVAADPKKDAINKSGNNEARSGSDKVGFKKGEGTDLERSASLAVVYPPGTNQVFFDQLSAFYVKKVLPGESDFDDIQTAIRVCFSKKEGTVDDRLYAAREAGKLVAMYRQPKLGFSILMSMLFDYSTLDPRLVMAVLRPLMVVMEKGDPFMVAGFLRGYLSREELLNPAFVRMVVAGIGKYGLVKHQNPVVAQNARYFLAEMKARFPDLLRRASTQTPLSTADASGNVLPSSGSEGEASSMNTVRRFSSTYRRSGLTVPRLLGAILGAVTYSQNVLVPYWYLTVETFAIAMVLKSWQAIISRYLSRPMQERIVFLTDESTSLSKNISHLPYVRMIDPDPVHRIQSYKNAFSEMLRMGFDRLVAILPDARYWVSYSYARDAAQGLLPHVVLVNAGTFGLGLGMLVESGVEKLQSSASASDVLTHIRTEANRVRYWVVVDSLVGLEEKYWFKRILKGRPIPRRLANTEVAILGFHSDMGVLGISQNMESAMQRLGALIQQDEKKKGHTPSRIVIKHQDAEKEAQVLFDLLTRVCPSCDMTLLPDSDFLNSRFGRHVGVSAL